MTLYSDLPVRRMLQLLADVLLVTWIVLWAQAGIAVHDATSALAEPGRQLDSSATRLAEELSGAGDYFSRVPLVGDEARVPFDRAADASGGIAATGRQTVEAVEDLAVWLGWSVALIPILLALLLHLPPRTRFVRRATAGRRFVDSNDDLDLFALRALARQPMHVLAGISDDPAGAWRRGDPEVVQRLAEVELRSVGLRR